MIGDVDRIVILRTPNPPATEARKVRKKVQKRLEKYGLDWPVVVLPPGFELDTVIV